MKKMIYILFCLVISYTFIACNKDDDDEIEYSIYDYHYESMADSIKTMIRGVWYQVNQVDSTVLVVDMVIKKYVYQRGTNHIIEMADFGDYFLAKKVYDNPKLGSRDIIHFVNYKMPYLDIYTSDFGFFVSKTKLSIWELNLNCERIEK